MEERRALFSKAIFCTKEVEEDSYFSSSPTERSRILFVLLLSLVRRADPSSSLLAKDLGFDLVRTDESSEGS